ncbi:hypothetical protein PBY51_010705 [Eleginops maclovinus]|uniref:Uncharacterized protein n=1 Tax=Eleginops maclovinus TaxID=56733 RepID=A0AAN8AEY5_ELEMC|nr:hypothetical protein PBY51_010705 [Eleginops maclovinus]
MLTSLEMIDSPRLAREEWRGEQSRSIPGVVASCRPAMAPAQCHFTSDGAPGPLPPSLLFPPSHPSLVSSKLPQSAQALIGLGQVSAIHFNHGPSTCQIIPSLSVCDRDVAEVCAST